VNRYDLVGRRAVITGGAGGIGRAIATLLQESGAVVELWDCDPQALAAATLGAVERHTVDVTAEASIEAALARARRIDILVNNAGILGEIAPVWDTDPAIFRRVLEVNLTGAYLTTRAVLRRMRAQAPDPERGRIVNIASIQGKEGMARAAAYSAAKAGLIALTKTVAKETARDGIIVTCVTPVAAETAMARAMDGERRADVLGRIPMGRFVAVEEIARLVAWLASPDCSFSTGGIFDISGGRATW
jgi:3-oxoacyl-[acyl-carrier protein] reductase